MKQFPPVAIVSSTAQKGDEVGIVISLECQFKELGNLVL
jgi:hypothetical protein